MSLLLSLHMASLVVLGGLIVSDFRRREIGVGGLILFGGLNITIGWLQCGWSWVGFRVALNLVLLGLLYLLLWFYVGVIRRRVYGGPLWRTVGAGDLLFLPVLAPLFELRDFVLFLTAAFILSLAGWLLYRWISKFRTTIPLVGTVGICWSIYSFFNLQL